MASVKTPQHRDDLPIWARQAAYDKGIPFNTIAGFTRTPKRVTLTLVDGTRKVLGK